MTLCDVRCMRVLTVWNNQFFLGFSNVYIDMEHIRYLLTGKERT
jgi:hypothetical protein